MNRLFAFSAFIFVLSTVAYGQTTSETKVICKGVPLPPGFSIVGDTQSKECPNQAWIIQRRRTPKMTNDGVVGSLNRAPKQDIESPLDKLLGSNSGTVNNEAKNEVKSVKPASSQWKKILPAKDEFSVMLPTTPEHYDGAKQGAPVDFYMAGSGSERYMLMSMKAPNEMDDRQRQLALAGFSKGFTTSMDRRQDPMDGAKLTFDKDINIMGLVGKQFLIESPEGKGAFRVYVSKQRLYFLGAVGASNSDTYKFLDSFKLTAR
jgi:hypothetical protein